MRSNQSQTLFLKYGLIVIGSIFCLILLINYLNGQGFIKDGESFKMTFYDLAAALIFPVIILILGVYLKDRVISLELGPQSILIRNGQYKQRVKWSQVEKIRLLWFIQPPLYVLRLKDENEYHLFTTGWFSVNILGFVWDPSEMGSYIKRKRKEYGFL